MESKKFQINAKDVKKVLSNALLFLAPVILLYITFVQTEINADGIQLKDFIPNSIVIGAMVLYGLNVITDFLKKLLAGK